MKNKIVILVTLLFCKMLSAQVKQRDTINRLSAVVVTGQFQPQSLKKSVLNVYVITSRDIQNLAATNLTDVINQYLNITTQQNAITGRSTVSLFGLDAQYFKVLVDNIPLVNEEGFGNNTDLSQINLNDVEQIEIVEGSMGVSYGANAVSGVLNIITKKSSIHKWDFSATAQEETVGKEFAFFDKGRHIQSIKGSHTFNDNWFVSIGANRNDFRGFLDYKKGKNYFENDGIRGFKWLPDNQLNATALIAYHKNDFHIFYKFEYLKEDIFYYNSSVRSGWNPTLRSYRYSDDKRYFTNRYFHNLNATGKLFSKLNYNISLSYQKQQRDEENFRYYLYTRTEARNETVKNKSMEVIYSRGTLSNFFSKESIVDLQIGYEITNNLGFSREKAATGFIVPITKRLENYDVFASLEIKPTEKFSILPGLRYSEQSLFKNQYASSIGLKYLFDNGIQLRGSFGNSFRTPTFEELYSKNIFLGHYFVGNENLIPETSTSFQVSIKKVTTFTSGLQMANSLTGNFLNVKDRIDQAFVGNDPHTGTDMYQYINIDKYQMWNVSTAHNFKKDNWTFNLGAALIGISQKKDDLAMVASNDRFLYSFNLNSSASYSIPAWKTTISAYYKYNGRMQQFVEKSSIASPYVLSEIDPSNWLDATIRKNFFKDRLQATIGARNLLNILDIKQSNYSGPHGESTDIMLAYGRSYFLKLTYNLDF